MFPKDLKSAFDPPHRTIENNNRKLHESLSREQQNTKKPTKGNHLRNENLPHQINYPWFLVVAVNWSDSK